MKEITDKVFQKIVENNSRDTPNSIPHSDAFSKEISSLYGLKDHEITGIINLLKEAHRIFSIELTQEDRDHDISRVDGYVEADLTTIRRLKTFFQKLLMDEYEAQHNTRVPTHQIIKDMYAKPNLYKNTSIGQIANKAFMLEEYENLIEKRYNEYTDPWKDEAMNRLLQEREESGESAPVPEKPEKEESKTDKGASQRAADMDLFIDAALSKKSLEKAIGIYGPETFCRISLRKYQFNLLKQVIESGEIDRKEDLKKLKSMISKMKGNMDRDDRLKDFEMDINGLERTVSRHILISKK